MKLLRRCETVLAGFRDLAERQAPSSPAEIRKAAEPLALLLRDVRDALMASFDEGDA
jgi:hypothetical protein